ncbi:MAG: hypothetical protein ACI8UO_005756 [Verrucomicrobiales bacterium]|jgi:hypothetical protein
MKTSIHTNLTLFATCLGIALVSCSLAPAQEIVIPDDEDSFYPVAFETGDWRIILLAAEQEYNEETPTKSRGARQIKLWAAANESANKEVRGEGPQLNGKNIEGGLAGLKALQDLFEKGEAKIEFPVGSKNMERIAFKPMDVAGGKRGETKSNQQIIKLIYEKSLLQAEQIENLLRRQQLGLDRR